MWQLEMRLDPGDPSSLLFLGAVQDWIVLNVLSRQGFPVGANSCWYFACDNYSLGHNKAQHHLQYAQSREISHFSRVQSHPWEWLKKTQERR